MEEEGCRGPVVWSVLVRLGVGEAWEGADSPPGTRTTTSGYDTSTDSAEYHPGSCREKGGVGAGGEGAPQQHRGLLLLGVLHGAGGSELHCMLGALQRGLFRKEDQTWDFLPCVHFPTLRVGMTGEMGEELSTLAHHGDCCTVALEMSRFVSSILVFHQPFLT